MRAYQKRYWILAIVSFVLVTTSIAIGIFLCAGNSQATANQQTGNHVNTDWDPSTQPYPRDPTIPRERVVTYGGEDFTLYYSSTHFLGNDDDQVVDIYLGKHATAHFNRNTGRLLLFDLVTDANSTVLATEELRKKALEIAACWTELDLALYTITEQAADNEYLVYRCIYGSEDFNAIMENSFAFCMDRKGNLEIYQHPEILFATDDNYFNTHNPYAETAIQRNNTVPYPVFPTSLTAEGAALTP